MNYLKWTKGIQNMDWFASNGTPILNNRFKATDSGLHTIYYENPIGEKRVYTFNIEPKDLDIGTVHYSISIDDNQTHMSNRIVYGHDCTGFTPAKYNRSAHKMDYFSWEEKFPFNRIRPCVIKDGVVQYYLDPNNYAKKLDGSPANITETKNDGDVVIEFPKIYWKATKINNVTTIEISNKKIDNSFEAPAHTSNGVEYDKLYIGAYTSYNIQGKARSVVSSYSSIGKLDDARTAIQANYHKYSNVNFYSLDLFKILYLLLLKTTDKFAIGQGKITSGNLGNGTQNTAGLFYGGPVASNSTAVKIFGLENMLGNYRYWIEGIRIENGTIRLADHNYNNDGTGYLDTGINFTGMFLKSGTITKMSGQTRGVFVPIEVVNNINSPTLQYSSSATGSDNPYPWMAGNNAGQTSALNDSEGYFKTSGGVNPLYSSAATRIQYLSN